MALRFGWSATGAPARREMQQLRTNYWFPHGPDRSRSVSGRDTMGCLRPLI